MGEVSRGRSSERESEFLRVSCGQCVYFNVKADMADVESTCKRLDHKHLRFAVPWFKSYDCGQSNGYICREFVPDAALHPYLAAHWEGFEEKKGLLGLVVDGDTSVRYMVRCKDFADGTFLNDDGSLKWVEKVYYKRCRTSPLGLRLIREKNKDDGLLEADSD